MFITYFVSGNNIQWPIAVNSSCPKHWTALVETLLS